MGTRRKTRLIAAVVLATSFCSVSAGSAAEELKVVIERNVPGRSLSCARAAYAVWQGR
jgi:hypothetical protein